MSGYYSKSKFLQGKVSINDKSLQKVIENVNRCCKLYSNIEGFAKYTGVIQNSIQQVYHKGLNIIRSKVYTKKKRGHYIINYYTRTYDLLKSYKFKFTSKIIDVKNGRFAVMASFYFDPKVWRTNYYSNRDMKNENDEQDQPMARSVYVRSKAVPLFGGSHYHADWRGEGWSVNHITTKRVGRNAKKHKKGGGKMLRPHSNTFGSGIGTNIGIRLIDLLDKGFTVGRPNQKNPFPKRVQGKDFLRELNKLYHSPVKVGSYSLGSYHETKDQYFPILGDKSGKWSSAAKKAFQRQDYDMLSNIAVDMEKELKRWSKDPSIGVSK